jgi:hypothetical protein
MARSAERVDRGEALEQDVAQAHHPVVGADHPADEQHADDGGDDLGVRHRRPFDGARAGQRRELVQLASQLS